MKEQPKLQWQGQDVEVKYGYCDVVTNTEKPLYWYNYHCRNNGKARLNAIKVITKEGNEFVIYNRHGIGWFKLSKGGWPNEGHASLPTETFVEDNLYKVTEYYQEAFRNEAAMREKWLEEKYPLDYKKMQSLLKMAKQ
jgi:hypothetical protein